MDSDHTQIKALITSTLSQLDQNIERLKGLPIAKRSWQIFRLEEIINENECRMEKVIASIQDHILQMDEMAADLRQKQSDAAPIYDFIGLAQGQLNLMHGFIAELDLRHSRLLTV